MRAFHVYDGDGSYLGVRHKVEPTDSELLDMPLERGGDEYQIVQLQGGPLAGEDRIILTTGTNWWPVAHLVGRGGD